MLNLQLANKYAHAVFLLAKEENKLEEYRTELKQLSQYWTQVPELGAYFANSSVPLPAKKEVAEKIIQSEGCSAMVGNFLRLLIDKGRTSLIPEIVRSYENYANEELNILVADVTTARPLESSLAGKLTKRLAELTGKSIQIRPHLKPEMIGGVIVRMGDRRIDGSLVTRMQALKEKLLAD